MEKLKKLFLTKFLILEKIVSEDKKLMVFFKIMVKKIEGKENFVVVVLKLRFELGLKGGWKKEFIKLKLKLLVLVKFKKLILFKEEIKIVVFGENNNEFLVKFGFVKELVLKFFFNIGGK